MTDNRRRKFQNIMIKPVHNCNMDCDYCFVKNLTKQYRGQKMSLDILNEIYRVMSNSAETVSIIWHGGEPTLVGTQWYKDAIELSYLYSDRTKFEHSIQSNGLLLDKSWEDLAKNYGVNISVSYDGLFQDYRKVGTGEIIKDKLLKFKENVGYVGCLSVITENSYKGLIQNYNYFKELGVETFFNYGINSSLENQENFQDIPTQEYVKEYIKYFKYWLNDRDGWRERSCIDVVNRVLGLGSSCCSTSDCRMSWLNINPDGSTSPCNRYFPEELGMGNITNFSHLEEIYKTDNYRQFYDLAEKRVIDYCLKCDYISYCNGGCNSLHLMNSGSIDKVDTTYCDRFKLEFTQVYRVLRNIDIYSNDNLNLNFLNILNQGVFTPKEIRDYLLDRGINACNLGFDSEDLLNCTEFKLFRLFNPIRKNREGHKDHFNFEKVNLTGLENITNSADFRNKRISELDYIFNHISGKVVEILKDKGVNP